MSNNTPTTLDIMAIYTKQFADETEAIAEFSRWLAAERKRVAEMAQERLLSKINRVTIVDDDRGGIQYERYDIKVEPSIQDDGRTLKLFIKGF